MLWLQLDWRLSLAVSRLLSHYSVTPQHPYAASGAIALDGASPSTTSSGGGHSGPSQGAKGLAPGQQQVMVGGRNVIVAG